MASGKLFVRDPREVPFLNDQVKKVLALADESTNGVRVKEDDDFGFMATLFLNKQIQHAESVLALVPRRDAGLVARTMIDGLYQLLWTYQAAKKRAKLWRSFAVIHDWRLIQGRLKEGIPVSNADLHRNDAGLREFGELHRNNKPKAASPFHKRWAGGMNLSDMAEAVGRELYDGPYAELSDWEHWGVSGIGNSISRQDGHITVNSESDRVAGLSLLAAFQCVLQTLEVTDAHLSLNIRETIQVLGKDFTSTMDSFYPDGR
jgi:hypothetical protein